MEILYAGEADVLALDALACCFPPGTMSSFRADA